MAQIVKLVDDLDGVSDAEMTLVFGLDGTEYEIDLNDPNYETYRATLELLASKGRVVTRDPVKVKRTLSTGKKTGVVGKTQHIRETLRAAGHEVSDRGRISAPLMEIYAKLDKTPKAPETSVEAVKGAPEGEDTDEDVKVEQEVIERVKATPQPAKTARTRKAPAAPKAEFSAIREVLSLSEGGK